MPQEEYNFSEIEEKWKQRWQQQRVFEVDNTSQKPKKYILDMFPYPSGQGLHVGHPEGYTATDIVSRYYRHRGYDVLHPMGWDAFGLPAENYAIKTGTHPRITTQENIATFKRQIQSLGFSYDWSRELNTSDPSYYRWTQWLFLELYKKGLAYKKEAPVNWCDHCKTVLANEQVVNGLCERCDNQVEQKNLSQWFFKTTAYAEELLKKIDDMDWPESLKTTQKNWIGRSEGANISFQIKNHDVPVFTTRPDTLFGVTLLVLAPEHEAIGALQEHITNWKEVEVYKKQAAQKSELQRKDLEKEKTGVQLKGLTVIHPATQEEIPVWIADYVMTSYGTGAIMAVPAHDQRDFDFAKRYNIPVTQVVAAPEHTNSASSPTKEEIYTGEGTLINSGEYTGMPSAKAAQEITKQFGTKKVQYKLRDWLVSRQRFWGAPIPIVYCSHCAGNDEYQTTEIEGVRYAVVPVPQGQLPVELPDDVDFTPTGESPLKNSKAFHDVACPACGATGEGVIRESDTMDTFVCSSWYFLRFTDPTNDMQPFSKDAVARWMSIDLYVGGMEHAVGHLIYARFITKALRDMGYVAIDEPFTAVRNQGLILGENGEKMSKSKGNVVNPDDIVIAVGADALRMYEMFMGPLDESKPWNTNGAMGVFRFLQKVWRLQEKVSSTHKDTKQLQRELHKAIYKITHDIEALRFNTAISAMMIYINMCEKEEALSKEMFETFILLLSPFAPFIAEELWERMGHDNTIAHEPWPTYDPTLLQEDEVTIGVQFNGKTRGQLTFQKGLVEKEVMALIAQDNGLEKYYQGEPAKVIFVPDKIINIIY